MLKYGWTAALYAAMSLPALAAPKGGHPHQVHGTPSGHIQNVPEIDASAGLLAIAAVATVVLFAWERSRRRTAQGH